MSYLTLESSFREEEKQMAEKTYKTLSSSGRIQKALKQAEYAIVHDKVGFIGFLILLAIIILSLILNTFSEPIISAVTYGHRSQTEEGNFFSFHS